MAYNSTSIESLRSEVVTPLKDSSKANSANFNHYSSFTPVYSKSPLLRRSDSNVSLLSGQNDQEGQVRRAPSEMSVCSDYTVSSDCGYYSSYDFSYPKADGKAIASAIRNSSQILSSTQSSCADSEIFAFSQTKSSGEFGNSQTPTTCLTRGRKEKNKVVRQSLKPLKVSELIKSGIIQPSVNTLLYQDIDGNVHYGSLLPNGGVQANAKYGHVFRAISTWIRQCSKHFKAVPRSEVLRVRYKNVTFGAIYKALENSTGDSMSVKQLIEAAKAKRLKEKNESVPIRRNEECSASSNADGSTSLEGLITELTKTMLIMTKQTNALLSALAVKKDVTLPSCSSEVADAGKAKRRKKAKGVKSKN